MVIRKPPHPGYSIRENCLDQLDLSVTEAAKVLHVARHTLSRVLNGHAAISPEMAIHLEKAGLVQCRVLAAPTDHLGSRPGAKRRRPDQRQAIKESTFITPIQTTKLISSSSIGSSGLGARHG